MISWSEILIRLSLAALFGGMVGIEREKKAASFHSHILTGITKRVDASLVNVKQ